MSAGLPKWAQAGLHSHVVRTPRHRAKASAACSTSMPSPSRVAAPWAAAQAKKGWAAGPYIRSITRVSAPITLAATGLAAPARLLAEALMSRPKGVLSVVSCKPQAASATPMRWASGWWRCTSALALAAVRLATVTLAGRKASKGPSTPALAPPAPISSTRWPATGQLAPWVMSAIRPRPSVLSPNKVPLARRARVLQAPASCTRSLVSPARWAACSLKGTVTLQPWPPCAKKARALAAKPSSGASRRSYTMAWPVSCANCW